MIADKDRQDRPEKLFRALLRTFGLTKRVMEPFFASYGISASQWAILRTLHRAKEEGIADLRLTDISGRLLLRPPSITRVVDGLEQMGLVADHQSLKDSRAKQVSLTTAGNELVERILEKHREKIHSILSVLGNSEQDELISMLDRIGLQLEKMEKSKL